MSPCAPTPRATGSRASTPLPEQEWDDVLKAVAARTEPLNVFTTPARHPALLRSWEEH